MTPLTDIGRAYLHLCAALRLADELGLHLPAARISQAIDSIATCEQAKDIDLRVLPERVPSAK